MKLVTFEVSTPVGLFQRLGAWTESHIVDLNAGYARVLAEAGEPQSQRLADVILPPDLRLFLEMGDRAWQAATETLAWITERLQHGRGVRGKAQQTILYTFDQVQLLAPLPRPNSLRDFSTFEQHVKNSRAKRGLEIPSQWYELPVYYKGNHRTIIGPEQEIIWPRFTQKLDYELEMACVIGREGRNISVEEAHRYIAGYVIFNDVSARDIQSTEMACLLGPAKGKDFCSVLGPYLVTADEMADPRNLKMTARVNGEMWSQGNTGDAHWTFAQMIAHVSQDETLYPGDVLGTGACGYGCGWELDRWLKPGDLIELEIEQLGVLRNRVGQPQA